MSNALDILQNDLGNVDLTPTLPKRGAKTLAVISKIEQRQSFSGKPMISYEVKTLEACPAHNKDVEVAAGYTRGDQIVLERTSRTGEDLSHNVARDLARFKLAVTGSADGAFMPLEQYLDCQVMVEWNVEESEQYGTQARIRRLSRVN